ncbi:MAG: transcription antitermination factor NusB [Gemmatimonadota bacterium]
MPGNAATDARRAALRILESCRRGQLFEHALNEVAPALDERDRRLAHELAAGVLRRQSALDRLLTPLVSHDWGKVPELLRDILRLGAYQLQSLSRVPPHAAVATSVNLARTVSGERSAGFVNAVLRRVAAQHPAAEPDTATHPPWLLERWIAQFGPENAARLVSWNDTRPRLAVQPAREPLEPLLERWRAAGIAVEAAAYGLGYLVDARRPDQLEGFDRGAFLVQDPAQAMVARFAYGGPGTVYDACAAPGGKTLALSHQGAMVVAADRNRSRLVRIRENVARAGSRREFPLVADAMAAPIRPVDSVLLDAPCLGTGTFSRHPDARWRVTPEALASLVENQRAMLAALAPLVRPGGMLIYATCSLEPEENECQVEAFLTGHPEFHREPNPAIPAGLLNPRGDLAILPFRDQMDGAYSARLRRTASSA